GPLIRNPPPGACGAARGRRSRRPRRPRDLTASSRSGTKAALPDSYSCGCCDPRESESMTLLERALCLPMLVALTACAASREAAERFVAIEVAVADWGDLELSHTALRLHAFEGQMDLQYAGRMPDSAGEELAGGTVYRIKNPDRYYRQNGQNTRLCAGPPRWVVVNSRTGAPAWSGEI